MIFRTVCIALVLISVASAVDQAKKTQLITELVNDRVASLREAKSGLKVELDEDAGEHADLQWGHVHWPHGHAPHGHHPHVHWPHGHLPHVHACHSLNEGLGTDSACCTKTKNYGSCSATVSMCFGLNSNSRVKAEVGICNPRARIDISPNISVSVEASCDRSFEVEESKEKKIFSYGLAKAELAIGYSLAFNAGLSGKVTYSMSPTFGVGLGWGGSSGRMDKPLLEFESGVSVSVDAEMYVGLGMAAIEMIGLGIEAKVSTTGSLNVTPNGISGSAGMTGEIIANAALEFPSLSLPSPNMCAADLSFGNFNLPSVGHEETVAEFSW